MRVLVTGARGFVGRHLVPRLLTRFPAAVILPPIADIADATEVDAAIATHRPDVCIHLAAISAIGAAEQAQDRTWDVNLHGTRHIAQAILRHAPESLLVFASTAEIYGMTFKGGDALDEDALLAPGNTYAATKAAADLTLGVFAARGLRTVRMRPFNHTGPGQADTFVVPAFATQIARVAMGLQPPQIKVGNLAAERDFLDVRDVCNAYLDAIARAADLQPGAILNLCSGQTRSIRSVLDDLFALSGVVAEIVPDPTRMRPSDIARACGDNRAAMRELGWAPAIAWQTTIEDLYRDILDRQMAAC